MRYLYVKVNASLTRDVCAVHPQNSNKTLMHGSESVWKVSMTSQALSIDYTPVHPRDSVLSAIETIIRQQLT